MINKFTTDFKVTFFQTDSLNRLAPGFLLALFQDTAIKHSDAVNYGVEYLLDKGFGWAILNWHVVINQMPSLDDNVKISTWCGKCGRHEAARSFMAENEKGETLAYAMTSWVLMNLEKRKPATIPPEMAEAYSAGEPNIIEKERYLIKKPAAGDFVFGQAFTVKRSDLDTNGHVNNTRYIVWAVDTVSDEIYDNHILTDIKVTYRKEAKKGDELVAKIASYYEKNSVNTVIYFVDKNEPDVVYVQVGIVWSK